MIRIVTEPWEQATQQLIKAMEMRGLHRCAPAAFQRLQPPLHLFATYTDGQRPTAVVLLRGRVRKEHIDPLTMLLPASDEPKLPVNLVLVHEGGPALHWGRKALDTQVQSRLEGKLECFDVEELALPLFDTCTYQPVTIVPQAQVPKEREFEKMLDSDPVARRLGLSYGTVVRIDCVSGYGPPCAIYRQVVSA